MKTIWQKCSMCKGEKIIDYVVMNGVQYPLQQNVAVYHSSVTFKKDKCVTCNGEGKIVFGWIEEDADES